MVLYCSASVRAYTTTLGNLCRQRLDFHGTRKSVLLPWTQPSCIPMGTNTRIRLSASTTLFTKKKEEDDRLLLNAFQTPIIIQEKLPTAEELLQRKTEKRALQFIGISAGLIMAYAGHVSTYWPSSSKTAAVWQRLSGPIPLTIPFSNG